MQDSSIPAQYLPRIPKWPTVNQRNILNYIIYKKPLQIPWNTFWLPSFKVMRLVSLNNSDHIYFCSCTLSELNDATYILCVCLSFDLSKRWSLFGTNKSLLPGIGGLGAMVGRGGVITPPPPHDPPVMEKSSIAMSPLKLLPLIPSKTI